MATIVVPPAAHGERLEHLFAIGGGEGGDVADSKAILIWPNMLGLTSAALDLI